MLRPGEENRLEEGINYFPAGAPRRTLFSTLVRNLAENRYLARGIRNFNFPEGVIFEGRPGQSRRAPQSGSWRSLGKLTRLGLLPWFVSTEAA